MKVKSGNSNYYMENEKILGKDLIENGIIIEDLKENDCRTIELIKE